MLTQQKSILKYEKYKDYMRQVPLYIPNPFYAYRCPSVTSFNNINDDCLLLTLSYLAFEDFNSVAICNQQCRKYVMMKG
jgi:hypothetical protein